jgi:hypothetical protein
VACAAERRKREARAGRTGHPDEVLTNGDGILLVGRTLYVVQNRLNRIAVVRLGPDYATGTVDTVITSPLFDVPATVATFGSSLYAVNARFTTPATPATTYDVVRVDR